MINTERLLEEFKTLVSFDAESFHEAQIKEYLKEKLTALGLTVTEDDAAETALMNLLFGGRIYTLEPKTYYEDKNLTVVRPMLTCGERLIRSLICELDLPVTKNPCGRESDSARAYVRKIISETDRTCRGTAHRIAGATVV